MPQLPQPPQPPQPPQHIYELDIIHSISQFTTIAMDDQRIKTTHNSNSMSEYEPCSRFISGCAMKQSSSEVAFPLPGNLGGTFHVVWLAGFDVTPLSHRILLLGSGCRSLRGWQCDRSMLPTFTFSMTGSCFNHRLLWEHVVFPDPDAASIAFVLKFGLSFCVWFSAAVAEADFPWSLTGCWAWLPCWCPCSDSLCMPLSR